VDLAENLIKANAANTALEILNTTPEGQKNLTPIIVEFGWAYWSLGKLAEMRKRIDFGLSQERSTDLLLQDSMCKLRSGNAVGARASIEEALKIQPNDIRALSALRQTYIAQQQPAMALQKMKEYAARMPESAPVQEFLGLVVLAGGDRNQARAAFTAAKAADPHFDKADLSLVQLDAIEGKWEDAAVRLHSVIDGNPANGVAHLWLGDVETMRGRYDAAISSFRAALNAGSNSQQAEVLNNLAYLLAEYRSDPDNALEYAQRAQELRPENPNFSDTLGWIFYKKGLYSSAVKYLEQANAKGDVAVWGYHLAMAYAKAGNLERARATLKSALMRDPHAAEAKVAQELVKQSR
jgi:tetratricopeptide (TPR) repeat protein